MLGQYDAVGRRIKLYKEALKTAKPVGEFINDKVVVSSIDFCDESKKRTREMNSPRLFGKHVIPHFKEKERRTRSAAVSAADNS